MLKDLFRPYPMFDAPTDGAGAGSDGDGTQQKDTKPGADDGAGNGTEKTFTRAQLAQIANKQVQEALEKFKTDSLPGLLAKAKEEGAADAKMSADELAQKQAKERLADIERREAELAQHEAEQSAKSLMSEKKVPDALQKVLLSSLVGMEPDARSLAVDAVVKSLGDAVQTEIVNRAKGTKTPAAGGETGSNMTQEKWDALDYASQAKIYTENPELAKKFTSI